MSEIKLVTSKKIGEIIEKYCEIDDGKRSKHDWTADEMELFLAEENGRWVACDNTSGHAWTEDFKHREVAEKWLLGEYDLDEAYEIDRK